MKELKRKVVAESFHYFVTCCDNYRLFASSSMQEILKTLDDKQQYDFLSCMPKKYYGIGKGDKESLIPYADYITLPIVDDALVDEYTHVLVVFDS